MLFGHLGVYAAECKWVADKEPKREAPGYTYVPGFRGFSPLWFGQHFASCISVEVSALAMIFSPPPSWLLNIYFPVNTILSARSLEET